MPRIEMRRRRNGNLMLNIETAQVVPDAVKLTRMKHYPVVAAHEEFLRNNQLYVVVPFLNSLVSPFQSVVNDLSTVLPN